MSGAVVELFGHPPTGLRQIEHGDNITSAISQSAGQHVRPIFFHRAGVLDYIWFSHGQAIPSILYDWAVKFLGGSVDYTWHRDSRAIHVWQAGKLVGLFWPCQVAAPEVVASAKKRLRQSFREV
jgi:hypothetical protein